MLPFNQGPRATVAVDKSPAPGPTAGDGVRWPAWGAGEGGAAAGTLLDEGPVATAMRLRALTLSPVLILLAAALAGCADGGNDGNGEGAGGTPPAASGRGSCDAVTRSGLTLSNASAPVVALATSKGCIVAELHQDKAPITVRNFLNYTEEGFFSDLLFHRVIKDFMVQTGGMGKDGQFKTATHPAIKNEARTSGLKNEAYTLAMARTQAADSATNQFFVNHKANTFLDPSGSGAGYAVFGTVVQGRDVVDAIAGVPVEAYAPGKKCQQDSQPSCPVTDVDLFSVVRVS